MKDLDGLDDYLPLAHLHHGNDDKEAASSAETFVSDSTGHDCQMVVSVNLGAIRVSQDGRNTVLRRGQISDETDEEEEFSCTIPNNNSSSNSGSGSDSLVFGQVEEQPSPVEGIAAQEQEPRLEDLAATLAALVQQNKPPTKEQPQTQQDVQAIEVHESTLDALVALAATVSELVHQQEQLERQPVVDAVTVQGTDEISAEARFGNNDEPNNNIKVCGSPQSWLKRLLRLGTIMILVALVYFLVRLLNKLRNRPVAVPISVIFNLLAKYIPNLPDLPLRKLAEYRAIEWLTQDNGKIFTKSDNGTFFTKKVESLVQRYAMAVFYHETGFSIIDSASNWL
jgi:hypothetical protein